MSSPTQFDPDGLIDRFHDSIKQCQIRFVNRYELATESEQIVLDLCLALENIVGHGFNKHSKFFLKHQVPANLHPPAKGCEIRLWNFISLYLTDYEVKRFQSLRNVHSDLGRSRSWLRNTLNEHSLHKYFALIFEDRPKYRRYFYSNDAFMQNGEVGTILIEMVKNLNNVLFALNIDDASLDVELKSSLPATMSTTMNENNLAPVIVRSSPSGSSKVIPIKNVKKRSNVIQLDEGDEQTSTSPGSDSDFVAHSAPVSKLHTPTMAATGSSEGPQRTQRPELALLTPAHLDRGSQSSLHSLGAARNVLLFPIANDEAQGSCASSPETITTSPKLNVHSMDFEKEKLVKENNLLRIQLKKYIAAIELMKCNNQAKSEQVASTATTATTTTPQVPSELVPNLYKDIASYERKLVQVSEMHGELVEFNEHLYRVIQQKDSIIARLRDELVELRGPLPDSDDIMSICSEGEAGQHSIVSLLPQPLIHIWVPTAFLSGGLKGKSHHIYQIYIRLRDEEWNVYRRYSQFYTLHKSLKERYTPIGDLEFPPKKAIGNKDSKVVQERRKKLEFYLRNVINHLQTINSELSNKEKLIAMLPFLSDKFFLQDRSQSEANLARSNQSNSASTRSAASLAPTPNAAYMGF